MGYILQGLVIKSISGEYTVSSGDDLYICKPRGVFRHSGENVKVGDYVDFDKDELIIKKVHKRKNDLNRPVIANVDKAFLVFSYVEPDLNLNLLDRMISIYEYLDIDIRIIFSKSDLVDVKKYQEIKSYYERIGYICFETSIDAIDEGIIKEIDNSICVLAGQSGVGKTTLVNNLDKALNLKTDLISYALGRGKHTTRHIELFKVGSGYLADAPGFGNIDFDDIDEQTLSQTFVEFFKESENCKFKGQCLHLNEPGCRIKEMVSSGEIRKSRYDNYVIFMNEIKENKARKY